MGIHDRDYYRDESRSLFDAWGRQGAIVWIIIITSVVFFLQCLSGGPYTSDLTKFGEYSYKMVVAGEVWRLLTPLFLHASLWHLFWNMYLLYWAGSRIEEIYGSRETASFYLLSGIFASAAYLLGQLAGLVPLNAAVIGASGAVMAVLVLFALHFPYQRLLLFWILPIPAWLLVAIYVALDLLGAASGGGPVAYAVHLAGALFALLYFQSGVRFTGALGRSLRLPTRRVHPQLRIVPREAPEVEPVAAVVESPPKSADAVDEHLEAKLDRILEKVSQSGQESLTHEERDLLVKASELYKKRRK